MVGLRESVRALQFAIHGVPATVTIPDGNPVETRIIWLTSITEPIGINGTSRADTRRTLAIRSDEVPTVPRGTIVEVTEHTRASPGMWRVDGVERVEPEHIRVFVLPVAEEES